MNITTVVILGTFGMLFLATTIVTFVFVYQKKLIKRDLDLQKMQAAYQKDLLKATIDAQEKERKRIAQDLHDDIGAMLSTIKLSVMSMLRGNKIDVKQGLKLKNTKELIDETVGNVRQLSRDLLPATLDEYGLVHALEQLVEKIQVNTHLQVDFKHQVETARLEKSTELALYRIIQELCNNIIKHANATEIKIWLRQDFGNLEIRIIDNGDGFMSYKGQRMRNGKNLGLGLKNIESRLSMINASIDYQPALEKGTKVLLKMGYFIENSN